MNNVIKASAQFWTRIRLAVMKVALIGAALAVATGPANAASNAVLDQNDFVGIAFRTISMALAATTVVF